MRPRLALLLVLLAASAGAQDPPPAAVAVEAPEPVSSWRRWLRNDYYEVHLNVRPRVELADISGDEFSQAWTVRTLFGVTSVPRYGLSATVEGEGTFSFAPNAYWDGVGTSNGKTVIADPPVIELNQGFAQYASDGAWRPLVRAGRQRIVYDDQRFVGDVGWRQNQQTFDAALGSTSFGVGPLEASYAYLWYINRIYGNKGDENTQNWDSNSHLFHVRLEGPKWAQLSGFAYLLDFEDDAPSNSSNSYGFRLHGSHAPAEDWELRYVLSYAYQTNAGENPVSYGSNYAWVEGGVGHAAVGDVALGWELLGSDAGQAGFVTPLSTPHRFDGFADAFLDNGGPDGLQDLFLTLSPVLPWGLSGSLILHQFWSDEGRVDLGREIDFVVSRPITRSVTALMKGAWFNGTQAGPADRWRWWLQLTWEF